MNLGEWRPTEEHAWQHAIEAGHASRAPQTARVCEQTNVGIEDDAEPYSPSTDERRWSEAIRLTHRDQDGTLTFLDNALCVALGDAAARGLDIYGA